MSNDLYPTELNNTDLSQEEWNKKREKLETLLFNVCTELLTLVDADTIEMEGKDPYFTLKITTLTPAEQAEQEENTRDDRTIN
jgi:hypothetical protein